jgi:hypothetical protein
MWSAVAQAFRHAAPPLAWYYTVTLALPLANGAAQAGAAFVEHAAVVLVLPPALIVLACATRTIARVLNRAEQALLQALPNAIRIRSTWSS